MLQLVRRLVQGPRTSTVWPQLVLFLTPHQLALVDLLDLTALNGLTHFEHVAHGLQKRLLLLSGETGISSNLLPFATRNPHIG